MTPYRLLERPPWTWLSVRMNAANLQNVWLQGIWLNYAPLSHIWSVTSHPAVAAGPPRTWLRMNAANLQNVWLQGIWLKYAPLPYLISDVTSGCCRVRPELSCAWMPRMTRYLTQNAPLPYLISDVTSGCCRVRPELGCAWMPRMTHNGPGKPARQDSPE